MKQSAHKLIFLLFLSYSIQISTLISLGFPANTLVKTAAGLTPIQNLEVGDTVSSYDFSQKKYVDQKIEKRSVSQNSYLIELTVDGDKIVADGYQAFYLPIFNTWRAAKNLKIGDEFFISPPMQTIMIRQIKKLTEPQLLYDLSIAPFHNFSISKNTILTRNFLDIPILR